AENDRLAEVVDQLFPLFVHRNRHDDLALKQIVSAMADETGAQAFIRQQRAIMGRPDCRPLLPTIACPTLVLAGDADELTPAVLSEEIAAGIPGARLAMVPNCGHLSTLEQPDAVTALLEEWLSN